MKLTLASVQATDPCNSHPMKTQNISISSDSFMNVSFSVNLCLLSPLPIPHSRHMLTCHSWLVVWLVFHINGIIQCGFFFCVSFLSFCIMPVRFTQYPFIYQYYTPSYCWLLFHFKSIPRWIYLFTCWWTLWLYPVLGCYECSFCEHPCMTAYVDTCCRFYYYCD